MAQTSWPFENVDTTETQFSQWARNIGEGVTGTLGTKLKPFGDSSGMQVKVNAGQSMVRGHYYASTATETLAVAAAHATLARIDNVVLELDPTANTILLKVVTGTAASTPTAPALVQTDAGIWQQLLGTVSVAAAATTISAAAVTDARVAFDTTVKDLSTASTYTVAVADKNKYVLSGAAVTVTVGATLSPGDRIDFIQMGSGQITFVASGATLMSADGFLKTAKQYAACSLVCIASGQYVLAGNMAA
jgi:hypothetical protein